MKLFLRPISPNQRVMWQNGNIDNNRMKLQKQVATATSMTVSEGLTDPLRVLLLESVLVLRGRELPPCGADGLPWGGLLRRKSSDLPVRRAVG